MAIKQTEEMVNWLKTCVEHSPFHFLQNALMTCLHTPQPVIATSQLKLTAISFHSWSVLEYFILHAGERGALFISLTWFTFHKVTYIK